MPDSVKIQVKLGDSEFNADGPETIVKAAFEQFLLALAKVPAAPAVNLKPPAMDSNGVPPKDELPAREPDQELLDRVFQKDDDIVSLRVLPQRSNPNWQADAVILLIYGFHRLANASEVLVTKLNQGLRKSGINLTRVDGIVEVHSSLYMKGGVRSGGRYTLNNQGKATAERWLKEQFN
jgi:hypothetical protein